MLYRTLLIILLIFSSCKQIREYKQVNTDHKKVSTVEYKKVKDNLYLHSGEYYIKGYNSDKVSNTDKTIYIGDVYIWKSDVKNRIGSVIDIESFERLNKSNYYKDKNNVYYFFRNLGGGSFSTIEGGDSKFFHVIEDSLDYGKSENQLFYRGEKIQK